MELKELVKIISEELGIEPEIEQLPLQPSDVPITYADVIKAARLLDYKPKVYIREGIRRFIEWEKAVNSESCY